MKAVVTNSQIFFLLLFVVPSYDILQISKISFKASGTGAWLSILIVTLIFAFGIYIIASLNKMFEGKTIHEYSRLLLGKAVSKIIGGIYTAYFLFILVLVAREIAEFLKVNTLLLTPLWTILAISLTATAYISNKGITNIARLCEIFGVLYVATSLLAHLAMLISGDMNYILPLFEKNQLGKYISGTLNLIVPLLGIELLTIIPFGEKNRQKGVLWCVMSIIFIGLFYIFVSETSVMMLGINDISNYKYPLIQALRETKLPSTILLERADLLFLTVGFSGFIASLCIIFFLAVENTVRLFSVNKKRRIINYAIGIAVFLSSTYLIDSKLADKLLKGMVPVAGVFVAFIIPITLFIIAKAGKNLHCRKRYRGN